MNIGIVILNYLNYEDTIECVKSAYKLTYQNKKIIVVDNASPNESFEKLKQEFRNQDVYLYKTDENKGYAKGNNYGINIARTQLNCEHVLIVNNDTVFTEPDFVEKLLVNIKPDTGAVGPKIIGSDGLNQNPVPLAVNIKTILMDLFHVIWRSYIRKGKTQEDRSSTDIQHQKLQEKKEIPEQFILHGSAILLTNHFFKIYKGFDEGTFLYYEENILAILLNKAQLKMVYTDSTEIFHKEDQSSLLSFNNNSRVKDRYLITSISRALILQLFNRF